MYIEFESYGECAMRNITLLLLILNAQTLFGQGEGLPFVVDNGTTRIKIGGYVQSVILSDFGGIITNPDFVVSTLNVPEKWDQQQRFAIDATASRIHLDVTHKTTSIGDINFFMETDFKGASNVLRLRHAYISFIGIIAGQTWSFMYDANATAPTVDTQRTNSRPFFRTPLVGYTLKKGERFSAGIAVEFPNAKITPTSNIISVTQTVPDIPAFIQYKSPQGHIRLSGVLRTINYGNLAQKKVMTKQGLGVQLSSSVNPISMLTLYGQGIYGKGIARHINDLAALSLDLLPEYANPDNTDVQTMFGAAFGIRADLSKKVYLTSNISYAALQKKEGYTSGSDYKYGSYFSASFFWIIYQNLFFATDYLHGYRQNMNSDEGNSNRIQTMLRYYF